MTGKRLLIVEDQALVAKDIEKKLLRFGYNVIGSTPSAQEAVRLALETQPSLILMDILLNGPMDGIQAAEIIHQTLDTPVIYLTAYADEDTLQRARLTTPYGYIVKPFEERELRSAIEVALYKHDMESESRAAAEFISAVTSAIPDVLYVFDLQQRRNVFANRSVAQNLGYDEIEFADSTNQFNIFEQIHPDDAPLFIAHLERLRQTVSGNTLYFEYRLRRKDGSYAWFRSQDIVFRSDGQGKATQILGIASDITSQKQAELERQQHLNHLELLNSIITSALEAPTLNDLMSTLADNLGTVINADGCYILQWDNERQTVVPYAIYDINQGHLPLVAPLPGEPSLTEAVLKAEAPIAVEDALSSPYISRRVAQQYPAVSLLGLPLIAAGHKLGAALLAFNQPHQFSDDEIMRGEQAARLASLALSKTYLLEETHRRAGAMESLEHVSSAMRAAPDRATLLPAILGQTEHLFNAAGALLALYDAENAQISVELAVRDWSAWTGQRIPVGDGISSWIIAHQQPYLNNDASNDPLTFAPDLFRKLTGVAGAPLMIQETVIGALIIGRESAISEEELALLCAIANMAASAIHRQTLHESLEAQLSALRSAQNRLLQTEKLAAIGGMIAGVAHELNNPLTSVTFYAQMAQQRELLPDTRYELDQIVSEAMRAAGIVRGLLDFARQRAPERKPSQINDVIKSSLDLIAYELRTHNITTQMLLTPDLPITMADSRQLQQVFINLITNAWQVMSETHGRGRLILVTESSHSTFLGEQSGAPAVIRITIQDDGPGIASEHLSQIFDPFFTTKEEKGTGLGLSICHGIVNEHGGHIWAEDTGGRGAHFIIELPILAPPAPQPKNVPAAPHLQAPHPGTLVLIVDDEPAVLDVLARALRRRSYQVFTAANGREALTLCESVSFNLILCDVRMPEVNGREFYRRLSEASPHLAQRIVFTTGDTVSTSTRRFLEETQAPYLTKPFELNDFLIQIHNLAEKFE